LLRIKPRITMRSPRSHAPRVSHLFMYIWRTIEPLHLTQSRDSSVSIALGYGMDDRGSRVRFPARAGNFSLHHRVQNGSGAHPASYPMGTGGSFLGDKAAGAWSWPLTSIWCRSQWMSGAIPPLLQYAFMEWCSVKAQGQLYLYHLTQHSHRSHSDWMWLRNTEHIPMTWKWPLRLRSNFNCRI
jgi:hypothetical protein